MDIEIKATHGETMFDMAKLLHLLQSLAGLLIKICFQLKSCAFQQGGYLLIY